MHACRMTLLGTNGLKMRLRSRAGEIVLASSLLAAEATTLGCSTHAAATGGAPSAESASDGAAPPATTAASCGLGLPEDSEGCIGADAGAEMVTSDGTPLLFKRAAPDPATGDWQSDDGGVAAQVFYSSADDSWEANILQAFDQPSAAPIAVLKGAPTSCSAMSLTGGAWTATLQGGRLALQNDKASFDLKRVVRASPTLCQPPPSGAISLFDGTSFDQWGTIAGQNCLATSGPPQWSLVDGGPGGAMEVVPGTASIVTRQTFGPCTIHVEFRTLGTPTHSGVFPEARYQPTILQTYGLLTGNTTGNFGNESPVVNPTIHAERPPLQWQTLDIDFQPPRAADGGAVGPIATVRLNGVTIFDGYTLKTPSGAASSYPEAPTGPVLLEYHGMPLQYRNIWILQSPP